MAKSAAITLAVLLAVFEIGSCMQCYQCNSQQDVACGDPFKSSKPPVDCASKVATDYNLQYLGNLMPAEVLRTVAGAPRYCHKIVTNSGTVVRTCLDVNPTDMNQTCVLVDNASKMANQESLKIRHCSVCNSDKCNGAGAAAISLPLAALAFVASYLSYKQ